jgi:hypothetical protein
MWTNPAGILRGRTVWSSWILSGEFRRRRCRPLVRPWPVDDDVSGAERAERCGRADSHADIGPRSDASPMRSRESTMTGLTPFRTRSLNYTRTAATQHRRAETHRRRSRLFRVCRRCKETRLRSPNGQEPTRAWPRRDRGVLRRYKYLHSASCGLSVTDVRPKSEGLAPAPNPFHSSNCGSRSSIREMSDAEGRQIQLIENE